MSGTKNTTDGTDALSLKDDDGAVQTQRIKEILNLRNEYITARNEVRSAVRTADLDQADGAELLKATLDSFLLDVRPIILQSDHADLWTNQFIATVELQSRKTTTGGHSGTTVAIPDDEIDIHGLQQLVKLNAAFDRKWRKVHAHHGPGFDDRMGDIVSQDNLPVHTAIIDHRVLDEAFTKTNDVLADLGLDIGLSDNANDIAEFDYSDLL
jgi:hypothetical protein